MDLKYLNDVLTSEGTHLQNIGFKVSELISHTNTLKNDVKAVVENGSIQFNPLLIENERLKSKADHLLKEMTLVQEEIDGEMKYELSKYANEIKNLSTSLIEANLFLEILKQLLEINKNLKQARKRMEKQEYYSCAELIITVQELVRSNLKTLNQVEVFKVLSQDVVLTYEELMYKISEIWSKSVNINTNDNFSPDLIIITLSIDNRLHSEVFQILKASNLLKSNLVEKKFSNIMLNDILKKVIFQKSKVSVKDKDHAVLSIEISKNYIKPNYLEVLNNIKEIINFLKLQLDVEVEDGVHFISIIGNYIAEEFAECLIKNCLSETIPTCSEDLVKYNDVLENAKVFEKSLQDSGFLPKSSSSLLDYAKNINVLFANKFCQSYLQKAKGIMKKDLHNIVKSEAIISNVNNLPVPQRNILREKMNIQEEMFSFPHCQISKQAEELMTLIYSMMKEIEKSLDLCAVRLLYAVRNIFEMYSALVPFYHKKFLETLPQQVAIFHNNCMYFAHNLINLTTEYCNKIPSVLKDHFMILLEEAVVLRSLAAETLEVTVTNQRNQLIYILRDSGFATLNENPKLDPNSEKSIRQCVRQLQILNKVWSDVLPLNVYNRAIGFLLDAIVEELITLILFVEDISSQAASDLELSFNIILEKGPSLFPESKEIHRHSRKWQKFKEFVLVLKGTLRDIDDRWANGMGPLAIEFTAEQVKHLIRALFQNSERRAALLARIR